MPGAGSANYLRCRPAAFVSNTGNVMASRDDILRAVRTNQPPAAALPDLAQGWITYPDRRRQFAELLEAVGGRCVFVADLRELNQALVALSAYAGAKRIVSLVQGAGMPNV